jgi:hypothetical protein
VSAERRDVRLGGVPIKVPVVIDDETTEAIVAQVNERLKLVEAQGGKINTQVYALQTAYQFAVDLFTLRKKMEADESDLIRALDKLNASLQTAFAEIESPKE